MSKSSAQRMARKYGKSQFREIGGRVQKTCTSSLHDGDRWLPYDEEHYAQNADGLRSECKRCRVAIGKRARERRKQRVGGQV